MTSDLDHPEPVRAGHRGATRYDATAMKGDDGCSPATLFDPISGELFLGTADELRQLDADAAPMTTLATTGRTFVESWRRSRHARPA